MLKEPLSTVFKKTEYLITLEKSAKNLYSDRQIVKIALNIISNMNDYDKRKSDWYDKTPGK